MPTKVFWIEPAGYVLVKLRRFTPADKKTCHGTVNGHCATVDVGKFLANKECSCTWHTDKCKISCSLTEDNFAHDSRWPTKCDSCDYIFLDTDLYTINQSAVYKNTSGSEFTLDNKVPGMMWDACFMGPDNSGGDHCSVIVVLPNGYTWAIDARANTCGSPCKNCGKPYNRHTNFQGVFTSKCHSTSTDWQDQQYVDARPHKCWVRSGSLEAGNITVKSGGCGATIDAYGGSLIDGYFIDA